MIPVNILEPTDIIQSTDWVRQLSLTYEGQSDYLQTTSTYAGTPINRLGWLLAKDVCPAFVGRSVSDFFSAIKKFYLTSDKHSYEFLRGDIPNRHKEFPL